MLRAALIAQLLARRLGFALVDTGAIYRCVALQASRDGIAFDDDAKLETLLGRLKISFKVEGEENRVFIGGEDVSPSMRPRAPPRTLGRTHGW